MATIEELIENGYNEATQELEPGHNGLSIVGLALGVLSTLCCLIPCLNTIIGLVGLILSIVGKKKADLVGLSVWAIVMNVVGLIASFLSVFIYIAYFVLCLAYM